MEGALSPAAALLAPQSIVVVGASERSRWATAVIDNLERHGFAGALHLVNRRGAVVRGRSAATSCTQLGEEADLGVLLVPAEGILDALSDLATTGARSALVLTSGFAETGAAGSDLQDRLLFSARSHAIRLLGPNSLGFMSFASGAVAWATPIDAPSSHHGVGLVSQSGATAFFLASLAAQQDIALSHVVSTGNEADLDACTFAIALAEDPGTTAVAMFLESVRHPDRFVEAAEAAGRAGKPLVVLKVGASEVAARSALAHTGAVVGDDGVFNGICERYGVTRVASLDELMTTADVIGRTGVLGSGGLAVVSNSGGVCEVAADAASALGIDLPDVSAETAALLQDAIPAYATPHNPLDLTGGIVPADCERIVAALARDYAVVLVPFYPVLPGDPADDPRLAELHQHLSRPLQDGTGFLVSYTPAVLTERGRQTVTDIGIPYLACGLDRAITALGHAFRWSAHEGRARPRDLTKSGAPIDERPRTELGVLALLGAHGVPVVPTRLVTDVSEVDGFPVVLKISSPDIAHKSEVGGVALGVTAATLPEAFARVVAAGRGARVDGVLVAPMRTGGLELFVGCSIDPVWGPVIAVGLGGVWVEVLADVAVRPLPVTVPVVRTMLAQLRGARLLAGERGTPAADLDAVARAVVAIGDVALRLQPDLVALDVNPLWVRGDQVEALDGLAVWAD